MAHVKSSHIATVAGLGCASLMVPSQAFAATITAQQAFDQFSAAGGTTFLAGAAAGIAVTSIVSFFEMRTQEKEFAQAQHLACSKAVEAARAQLASKPSHFAPKNEYSATSALDDSVENVLDIDLSVLSTATDEDIKATAASDSSVQKDSDLLLEAEEEGVVEEVIKDADQAVEPTADTTSTIGHRSFFEERASRGVPVIARAQAADDIDDWGSFTADIDDDLSISCDPVSSRDLHEIAFTQLAQKAEEMHAAREQKAHQPTSEPSVEPACTQLPAAEEVSEVEPHDYSGNEAMWAQALAVLEETESEPAAASVPAPVVTAASTTASTTTLPQQPFVGSPALSGVVMAHPVMYVPAVPTYAVPVAYQTAAIPMDTMSQMSITNHVDELVKEEFSKCPSANVRRASLEIIDGESKSYNRFMPRHA